MAEGDIGSVLDTALFEPVRGGAPRVVLVSATVVAMAYYGPDFDGWLKTISIASDGTIGAVIDSLEFDTEKGICPDIIHVTGDIYAIAYRGPDDDGFVKTVDIDASGNIGAVQDTQEINTDFCDHPTIVHVAGEVYAIAHDSDDIATVSIDAAGNITYIDHGNFDSLGFVNSFPHIIKIADTVFAIAYAGAGSDGYLKTVSIANDGTIGALIDTLEFDTTYGIKARMVHVTGDIYAIAYEGPDNDGLAVTVDIDASGNIGAAVIDTLVFESIDGKSPDIAWVSGDVFAITYNDWTQGDDGWIKTYHINADGTFGALIDTLEFENLKCSTSHLLFIGSNIWAIVYDVGAGDAGKIITLEIITLRSEEGVYVFLNSVDITDDILAARTERGWDEELQQASSGIAELICDNQNGDFSPENVAGAYYGDLALGATIQVYEIYGGITYYHFTGRINKITPHAEKENLIAYISALDGMDDLAELEINTVLRADTDSGTLVDDILDAAAWASGRDIDTGVDVLQVGWFHKSKALGAIRVMEAIELGRFHVKPTGVARWENRHARLTGSGLVSQHDFEDTAVEVAYEWSKRLVQNQVVVRGRRYYIGGVQLVSGYDMGTIEDELVWSAHTGDAGAPRVSKQGSLTLWAEFGSPLQSYDSLVKGTHWNANTVSDKSGVDVSDNITLVQTQYGQSVKLQFSNSGNQDAYLVVPDTPPAGGPDARTVLVYGVLYSVEVMAIAEEDATSQSEYGKRGLALDVPFKSNPNDIQGQAQFLLYKYKDAVPRAISVRHIARAAWPDDTIRVQCLTRDISDRITLKSTKLGIDADYYINKVIQDYIFQEAGMVHETTWVIERALGTAEGVFWLLGIADFGELGETTKLGV